MSRQETLPLLNGIEQYRADLAMVVQSLSDDQRLDLVERACGGEVQARQALIEDCLTYVVIIAQRYVCYLEYNDLLELIAVGNLAVVEKFDQALMKVRERVTAYLCGVARWTIRNYCLFHSRLIHIPNHEVSLLESAPRIESLDVLFECGDDCDGIQIQAAEQEAPAPNERMNQMLYKALDELTAKEREVVECRYGLHGAPASLADVGRQLSIAPSIVYGRHVLAIKHLRKMLLPNS